VNLFMDYETFGEHQWAETGIFEFMRRLPAEILAHPDGGFVLPSEAASRFPVRGTVEAPEFVSWADAERDTTAWLGNSMQRASLRGLFELREPVRATRRSRCARSTAGRGPTGSRPEPRPRPGTSRRARATPTSTTRAGP
jgi:alpha-amylase/alpha-mannosidase (GH57 family)